MNDSLYSLAYFSASAIDGDEAATKAEINRILEVSRENNAARHITGVLLYSQGYFAQILEGKLPQLEPLFETIQADDRHSDVVIIHYHPITKRNFGRWGMRYAYDPDLIPTSEPASDESLTGFSAHLMAVLKDYIQRNEGDT